MGMYGVCVCLCAHMWKQEQTLGVFCYHSSCPVFKNGCLIEQQDSQCSKAGWPAGCKDLPASTSQC